MATHVLICSVLPVQHAAKLFAPLVSINRVFTLPVVELSVPGQEAGVTKVLPPLGAYTSFDSIAYHMG